MVTTGTEVFLAVFQAQPGLRGPLNTELLHTKPRRGSDLGDVIGEHNA